MIKSMTGYGKGEYETNEMRFVIEVKSVNHRYCDITVRMPRAIASLEERIRRFALTYINRGKVDIYINFYSYEQNVNIEPDKNLVKSYIESLNIIKEEFSLQDDVSLNLLTRFPDILRIEKVDAEENLIWDMLKIALQNALESFSEMRNREGERLYKDMLGKIASIETFVNDISIASKDAVIITKDKFYNRVKDLIGDIDLDENRLIAEVAIMADKISIDEEVVRLKSHIEEFKKTIDENASSGKKLDFIIQEINREANTIASKANELDIINNIVNVKTEVEKIREQVQNIE
ncbi:MAG: YicC family protein [Firmicutes bacterium]|nr:YicC family protein [Bacillota bacterium]